jgi:hypothetical protein
VMEPSNDAAAMDPLLEGGSVESALLASTSESMAMAVESLIDPPTEIGRMADRACSYFA